MSVRIAHVTDLHFGADDPAVVAALLAELNADPPDLVAISGDLTQGARLSEFHRARAFMDALTAPTLAVPGNHDISPYNLVERFTDPYRRWRNTISPETAPQWRKANVAVLGLNSARRMGFTWDWSKGRVTHHRCTAARPRAATTAWGSGAPARSAPAMAARCARATRRPLTRRPPMRPSRRRGPAWTPSTAGRRSRFRAARRPARS